MLFTIQSFVEDYLNNRGFVDIDGYAQRFADVVYSNEEVLDKLLKRVSRLKTAFFSQNRVRNRRKFEEALIKKIKTRIKRKSVVPSNFPGGTLLESQSVQKIRRLTISTVLLDFKKAVESRAIDMFWVSRKKGELKHRPEEIAQGLLAVFIKGVLQERGVVIRELTSGIGYVDLGVIISSTLHLIEMKILTKGFLGAEQLEIYMKTEGRNKGNLLVLDAMLPAKKIDIPEKIISKNGIINVYVININPSVPSSLNILKH